MPNVEQIKTIFDYGYEKNLYRNRMIPDRNALVYDIIKDLIAPSLLSEGEFIEPSIASPAFSGTSSGNYVFAGTFSLTSPTINSGSLVTPSITNPTITNIIKLVPRAGAPSGPSNGWIYANSTDDHIYCRLGGAWVQLDN